LGAIFEGDKAWLRQSERTLSLNFRVKKETFFYDAIIVGFDKLQFFDALLDFKM
jgi:hypothetical protein